MVNVLDATAKKTIEDAIRRSERLTSGEIRVHLQHYVIGDVFEHAKKIFRQLGMGRTKEKNAVLIFVAVKTHKFALLGDGGIHERVGDGFWQETRDIMLQCFRNGKLTEGIVAGVENVGLKLAAHFPRKVHDQDELSNEVTER